MARRPRRKQVTRAHPNTNDELHAHPALEAISTTCAKPVFLRKLRRFTGLQLISLLALAAQPLRFRADISETVNVLYHAACLSGNIGCTKPIFEAFWHRDMSWQPADQTALDQFAAVFEDAVRAAPTPDPAPLMPNLLGYFPAMQARQNLLLGVIEGHSDPRLRPPLDHFRRRLRPLLQSTGNANIRRHTPAAVSVLDKYGMPDVMARVAAFMESPIRMPDVFIHAIARPFGDPKHATATVRANHFFVEVTSADKPEDTRGRPRTSSRITRMKERHAISTSLS